MVVCFSFVWLIATGAFLIWGSPQALAAGHTWTEIFLFWAAFGIVAPLVFGLVYRLSNGGDDRGEGK